MNAVDPAGESGAPLTPPSGRRAQTAVSSPIGAELRRRREMLRIGVREAARRTGVSHTVISEVESGRRLPTVRTFERLRRGLGLDATAHILLRPPEPVGALEVHLVRLAACLWASGGRITITDLAGALGIHATAVREQLPLVAPRLAACGISDDRGLGRGPSRTAACGDAGAPGAGQPPERSPPGRPLPRGRHPPRLCRLAPGGHPTPARGGCVARTASLSSAAWSTPASSPRSGTARAAGPTGTGSPPLALEAFEVASLEELHQKLEPFLGGTALADGAVTVDGEGPGLPNARRRAN